VPRLLVLGPLVVAIAGLILVVATGSLLGAALIVGGAIALLVATAPAVVRFLVALLSSGGLRRR
jgi:hypothetical protein